MLLLPRSRFRPSSNQALAELRLVATYRAGELPDYMLEFVDSLRTQANPTTS